MTTTGQQDPAGPDLMDVKEVADKPTRFGLPRGVVIMVGLAATVIVAGGMRAVAEILAPIFLALALTVTVYPARGWLERRGMPRWLSTLLVILCVYAILIGLFVAFALGLAQLASLLPEYQDQIGGSIANLESWLSGLGVGPDQIQAALQSVDPSTILDLVTAILGSVSTVLTNLIFVIVLVLFLGLDSALFSARKEQVHSGRQPALSALGSFALGTRKYFAVATVFGAIVAVLDTAALLILGIPAAALWGLLAFVTNYIPNVGFIIGLVPPALLGLLTGGVDLMVAVIVVYSVLNFVIQSVIQPKFVGDAVGLTTTISFLSLIVWAYILGPLGAILAVPMSLLVKAMFVDMDPDSKWLQLFVGDEPNHGPRKRRRKVST